MKKLFKKNIFQQVVAQTALFDIALGLAIAGVFVKLVNSFVTNILTPPLGSIIKGKSLANFEFSLTLIPGRDPVLFRYGIFLDALIEFLIVVFLVYWMARLVLRVKLSGVRKLNQTKPCPDCAMQIPGKAIKCPYCSCSFQEKL
ncbi:MAG: MscL family protein [Chlamydiales bacterium]